MGATGMITALPVGRCFQVNAPGKIAELRCGTAQILPQEA